MSFSLINKGLELIEEDFQCPAQSSVKTKINSNSSKRISKRKGNANKTGRDPRSCHVKKKSEDSFTNRKIKSAFDKYIKNKTEDYTLNNIKTLQKFDEKLSSNVNLDKVKEYYQQRLTKSSKIDLKKKSEEASQSVFTEEDFERINNDWLAIM